MTLRQSSIITTLVGTLVALPPVPALAQKAGQTFKSPLKNFTVPVPALGLGGTLVAKEKHQERRHRLVHRRHRRLPSR